MDRKLLLISALAESMSVIDKALSLRQNAQLTNGLVDRATCDASIKQCAILIKEVLTELSSMENK